MDLYTRIGAVARIVKIKDELGLKSRCMPFDNNLPTGDKKCICCGKDAKTKIYWAKQY